VEEIAPAICVAIFSAPANPACGVFPRRGAECARRQQRRELRSRRFRRFCARLSLAAICPYFVARPQRGNGVQCAIPNQLVHSSPSMLSKCGSQLQRARKARRIFPCAALRGPTTRSPRPTCLICAGSGTDAATYTTALSASIPGGANFFRVVDAVLQTDQRRGRRKQRRESACRRLGVRGFHAEKNCVRAAHGFEFGGSFHAHGFLELQGVQQQAVFLGGFHKRSAARSS